MSVEGIARLAEQGKDVSRFFTNRGRMMPPIQRVNVDFTAPMLEELDRRAEELNISRQQELEVWPTCRPCGTHLLIVRRPRTHVRTHVLG